MAELVAAPPLDRFVLRGPGPFSIDVPARPMRTAAIDGGAALWLGPDEYFLLVEAGAGPALAARVTAGAAPFSLVDVSHRSVAFRLVGDDAATLLNGAVALDLGGEAFPVGMCVRTICEKAEIVLWRRAADTWHVEVARSFAPYVHDLLAAIAEANAVPLKFHRS